MANSSTEIMCLADGLRTSGECLERAAKALEDLSAEAALAILEAAEASRAAAHKAAELETIVRIRSAALRKKTQELREKTQTAPG